MTEDNASAKQSAALMAAFLRDCGGDAMTALQWACRHLVETERTSSAGFRRLPPPAEKDR